jgi:hypothetical protein
LHASASGECHFTEAGDHPDEALLLANRAVPDRYLDLSLTSWRDHAKFFDAGDGVMECAGIQAGNWRVRVAHGLLNMAKDLDGASPSGLAASA